jgi:hypothetical protein
MSWLDDIIDVGSKIVGGVFGGGDGSSWAQVGSGLAKSALAGFALNSVTKSINRENNQGSSGQSNSSSSGSATGPVTAPDPGVRLQVNPSPDQKIPVIYGRCAMGGIITDAQLSDDSKTMAVVLTICEKTGKSTLGTGSDSYFTFKEIYRDNQKVVFKPDGVTVDYTIDPATGAQNTDISGLVRIYCYNGGSQSPVAPYGYSISGQYAWGIMPNWDSQYQMTDLIFAIVFVDYNKDKGTTDIGDMTFVIENSMVLAGDCLYDYMTNTKYGAGINPAEIYSS